MTREPTPPSDLPPTLASLLGDAAWVRALARSLLAGPAAEDLAQDAWVVALQNPPEQRGNPRAWFRTVLGRLATRRRSREARRPAIESLAARPEHGSTTGEVREAVERMELQQWLARALLALDEPYRSAVILRHLEGLDARAIAARQDCTPDVARQRVSRGLARLRTALDTTHGDRRAWALLLTPLAAPTSPPPLVPWITGGMLVSTQLVLGSAAAALAVGLVWWAARPSTDTSDPRRSSAEVAGTAELRPTLAPAQVDAALIVPREAPVSGSPTGPTVSSPPPAPDPRLAGRVTDREHHPIPGAAIVLLRPELGQFSVLDLEVANHPEELARAWTDEDGGFAFDVAPGIAFDLAISAAGFCAARLQRRHAGRHDIVLTAGFVVHGSVTRARDGAPVADAPLRVFQLGVSGSGIPGRTDARGAYEVRFPYERDAILEVLPVDVKGSDWLRVEPGPSGTVQMDLALDDGIEVRGTVVDARSGAPIAGARIGEGWTFRRSVRTDAAGHYRFPGIGETGVLELHVTADGYGKDQRARFPPVVDGIVTVDFALQPGRTVRGRVIGPDGRPVPNAYVCAVGNEMGSSGQRHDWRSAHSDAFGRFELHDLIADLRHCLVTSAPGLANDVVDLPREELDTRELDVGDIRLAAPALVAGTVTDDQGRPVANVEVQLSGTNRDRDRLRAGSALEPESGWYVKQREGQTDADGRFAFGDLGAGDYALTALRPGRPPSPKVPVTVAAGERVEGIGLTFLPGEALRGRVVDANGHGLEGVYVGGRLQRSRKPGSRSAARSQLSARTGPDGAFVFEDLTPGHYALTFHPFETQMTGDPWLETEREGVETGQTELRVELPRGAWIRGRVVDDRGAARVGDIVVAVSQDSPRSPTSTVDETGAFALAVDPGTVWDLELHGPHPGDTWETVFHTEYAVAAGTDRLEVVAPLEPSER